MTRTIQRLSSALLFTALTICLQTTVQGQGCSDPACFVDSFNISTGYDQGSGSLYTPVSQDGYWRLTQVPSNSGITLPAPTWAINPFPSWSSFSGARWISPFQNSSYNVNNPAPTYDPFTFENCFCVCQNSNVRIRFDFMCDDYGWVYLDGNLLTAADSGYHFLFGNRKTVDTTIALTAGQHCLQIDLRNISSVAMGVALEGFIYNGTLLSSQCCNPLGSICGTKYNDLNCDGVVSTSDPGLSGWTINLYDNSGGLIGSTVTDGVGSYCFDSLPAGNYTVEEVNQTGWTQTFPASGTHSVSLAGGVQTADFGNCSNGNPDPCDFDPGFEFQIERCAVTFTSGFSVTPPAQVVSTLWTFGDGTSSTDANPLHYYTSPGTYQVCLQIVVFDGKECCIKEVCREITIREECEPSCEIEAKLLYEVDDCCHYEFEASILSAQTQILGYYWDFGDGTTGVGSPEEHIFPGPGTYTVCLTILGQDPRGECCWVTICEEVTVECEPLCGFEHPEGKRTLHNLKVEGNDPASDLVLYPNPATNRLVLEFDLPTQTRVSVVFYDAQGREVFSNELGGLQEGEQQVVIQTDRLSTGIYLCEVKTNESVLRKQFVIKK